MSKFKLNLGQFNQCVEYLPNLKAIGGSATYPTGSDNVCRCIDSGPVINDRHIVPIESSNDSVAIPLFDIGVGVSNGRICNPNVIKHLLAKIELDIFVMIKEVLDKSDNKFDFDLNKIHVPVRSIQFFDEDKRSDGCYGWASIGIAVIT